MPRAEAHGTVEVTLAEVAKGTERTVAVDGRRLQVKIPAGVADGAKIRLRDQGVTLTVKVKPDPRFTRDGADLSTTVPVTLAEALLGAEVPVPSLNGKVKLRIRPNTQNGQVITVRGRGLPKRGKPIREGRPPRHRSGRPPPPRRCRTRGIREFAEGHPQPPPRTGSVLPLFALAIAIATGVFCVALWRTSFRLRSSEHVIPLRWPRWLRRKADAARRVPDGSPSKSRRQSSSLRMTQLLMARPRW